MEVESVASGRLPSVHAGPEDKVQVGQTIAILE